MNPALRAQLGQYLRKQPKLKPPKFKPHGNKPGPVTSKPPVNPYQTRNPFLR